MILSEFELIETIGGDRSIDQVYFAEVTVTSTTGILWWKKIHVVRRSITRSFGEKWFFMDDGQYTPKLQAEELERSYRRRKLLDVT
jgi:hypothetical protein